MYELAAIVGIIMALSEIIKQSTPLKSKYLPLVNLGLGLLSGMFLLSGSVEEKVLTGIIIGLSASGLYDHTKITKSGVKKK